MRTIPALVAVLLVAPFAAAQVPTEEATARLQARRAATQPVTVEAVQAENKQLRVEVATLRQQLEALDARLRAVEAKEARQPVEVHKPAAAVVADPAKVLHNGMSVADAEQALGTKLALIGTADGVQTYHTTIGISPAGQTLIIFWDITLTVENDAVTHSEIQKKKRSLPPVPAVEVRRH